MKLSPTPAANVTVEVCNLRKSFHGEEVLKGISLEISPGGIFVIMGPSGSGKSVLLKHIIGLLKPDSGQIFIQGEPVDTPNLRDKYRMAMVFQSGALLSSLTVGENVGLYLSEHQLKSPDEIARVVSRKLADVGLAGEEDRMPNDLSGGMQKRVGIARALVMDPQLILFDEPTSELDPLMTVRLGEEILKLKNVTQATSIVVTHDLNLAFGIADRLAMMMDGEILFVGTPGQLCQDPNPLIQSFIHAQLPPLNTNTPAPSQF